MLKKVPTIELCWIGDPLGRLLKGVQELKPDEIYPIIESRDPKWREYHLEKLGKMKKWLGKPFEGSIKEEIVFEEDVNEKDFMDKLILKMFKIMREIQEKHKKAVVVFDVTAAPASVMLMAPLICELLSGENTPMVVQYVCRKGVNDPVFHAAEGSAYYNKHSDEYEGINRKSLASYNKMVELDEGGEIRHHFYPRFKVTLLGSDMQDLAKQVFFLVLPPSEGSMERAEDVQRRVPKKDMEIIFRAARERLKIKSDKSLTKEDMKRIEGSITIWRTRTLQELRKIALVETETIGRNIYAKRTYAGDMFISTIKALKNQYLTSHHK